MLMNEAIKRRCKEKEMQATASLATDSDFQHNTRQTGEEKWWRKQNDRTTANREKKDQRPVTQTERPKTNTRIMHKMRQNETPDTQAWKAWNTQGGRIRA